ncbi:MAG: hypothetical protein ABIR36_02665 [Nitrospiraceae bacterium]
MTEDNQKPGFSQLAELIVSAERHQQLQDIVGYVQHLHSFIDPDMYRLSLEKLEELEELEWSVEGVEFESEGFKECLGFTMQVSWEDLMFLETVVAAADTYSHRSSTGQRVESITDQGFDDLKQWLVRSEDDLFRGKITRLRPQGS